MDVPRVSTCFCGLVPLRAGAIIVSVVCLIIGFSAGGVLGYYSAGIWNVINIIFDIAAVITSGLLLYAVLKNSPTLMQPFLVVWSLLIVFYLIQVLFALFGGHTFGRLVEFIAGVALSICVIGYCLVVVYSYYVELLGGTSSMA